jgi:hypothetical protein
MVTIERTDDIPADREEHSLRILDWILHPIRSRRSDSWAKMFGKLDEYRRTHGPFFSGMDGLVYQRNLRDEWPD